MLLGKKTITTGTPTGALTLDAPIRAGATIVLTVIWSNDSPTVPTIVSVTDTGDNAYSVDTAAGNGNGTVSGAIITAPVTTALRAGDTITVTISTNRQRWVLRADSAPALGPVDRTAVNHTPAISAAMSTGVTAKTRTARQLVVALFGFGRGGLADGTLPAGWDGGPYITTAAGSADRALLLGYRTVESEGPQEGTAALTVPAAYSACIATYPIRPVFPAASLKVDVELKVGEQWERITKDAFTGDPITIERGRADEASEVTPSKLTLTLRNTAGKYSPRNPLSPYYGLIGRNTPIRVSVNHPDLPPATPYAYMPGVTGHYISTPNSGSLNVVGDLDVRIDVTPDTWRPGVHTILASKYEWRGDPDQLSWALMVRTTGQARLAWSPDGQVASLRASNSTIPLPTDSSRLALRATLDVDNGAGGRTVTFYTAPGIDGPWTPLGDPIVTTGTTSVYAGTAPVEIGSAAGGGPGFSDTRLLHGRVHDFQLRDGAGTVIADPGISAGPNVTGTEWDGPDGRLWTAYDGARIITGGPGNRFVGEVSAWPPHWSLGGHHQTVPIEASGIKRRLGQGSAPVQSLLRRSIPPDPLLAAYWPMEDAGGQAVSAYTDHPPMRVLGNSSGIEFASNTDFVASAPLPVFGVGRMRATVPGYTPEPEPGFASGGSAVMFLCHMPSAPAAAVTLLQIWTTGTANRYDVWVSATGELSMSAYNRDGVRVDSIPMMIQVPGRPLLIQVDLTDRSDVDSIDYNISAIEQGVPGVASVGFGFGGGYTLGRITSVIVGGAPGEDIGGTTIGHLCVYRTRLASLVGLTDEFNGFAGEAAADRLARLAAENSIPLQIVGELAGTAPMGPQRVDTPLALLEECAAADGGILGEARDELGLLYRTRASLYNQAPALALDYTAPGLAAPFEPTDDDQGVRNHIAVTRAGGSSALAVREDGPLSVNAPPDGVGVYDDSVTVNVATDEQLGDVAGWLLHLGTWDESRYPSLGAKLHKAPQLLAAATRMDFGDRATVDNLPPWLPPGPADALIQGYVEVLELLRWRIDCNATPAGPWNVAVVDEARADTSGSVLAAAVDEAATGLVVRTTQGPFWTTDPADLPLAVSIGGEEMTVTAIGPAGARVADAFSVTVTNGWGSADTGQAWTVAAGAASDFSAAASTGGVIASSTVGAERGIVLNAGTPHQSLLVHSNTPVIPTGGPITWGTYLRWSDASNYYWVGVEVGVDSSLTLRIRKRVAGVLTLLTSSPSATGHALSPWRVLRAEVVGSTIRARVWSASQNEPAGWEIEAVDTDLAAGSSLGCVVRREVGSTNGTTTAFDLLAATPVAQPFTVTRSANGITKSHAAGADVRLAHPAYIAR